MAITSTSVRGENEAEALLCCARTCLDWDARDRFETLVRLGIDWERLAGLARQHNVTPLLYRSLNAAGPSTVPDDLLGRLRNAYQRNAVRNLVLSGELIRLLGFLERDGIEALPFKGPVLAWSVYGDLALRRFGDLDILVRPEDALRARSLLLSLGYRQDPELSDDEAAVCMAWPNRHHFVFLNADRGCCVELHWKIKEDAYSVPLETEPWWDRLVSFCLAGARVRTFSPPDLLLLLILHGTTHGWDRLAWICDIAELLRIHQDLDWPALLRQARTLRITRMFNLGLLLANGLLGASLPAKLRSQIQADPVAVAIAGDVRRKLFQDDRPPIGEEEKWRFFVATREDLRDRIWSCHCIGFIPSEVSLALVPPLLWRILRRFSWILPNEKDLACLRLPRRLRSFYYLVRPVRLAVGSLRYAFQAYRARPGQNV
jgi:hypothetical protein